jgi:hypothetical protein
MYKLTRHKKTYGPHRCRHLPSTCRTQSPVRVSNCKVQARLCASAAAIDLMQKTKRDATDVSAQGKSWRDVSCLGPSDMVALRTASQRAPLFQRRVVFPRSSITVVPYTNSTQFNRQLTTSIGSGSLAAGAALAMPSARLFARPRIFLRSLQQPLDGRIQLGDLLTQFASSSQTWTTGTGLDDCLDDGRLWGCSRAVHKLSWMWLAVGMQPQPVFCVCLATGGLETLIDGRGVQAQKLNRTAQGSRSRTQKTTAGRKKAVGHGQQIKVAVRAVAVAVESPQQRCAQHVRLYSPSHCTYGAL